MTRSKRMQPVVNVAGSKEQEAARQLGECQRVLDARTAQLNELLTYQAEYAQRFEASGGAGLGTARLQDYRLFLARLNDAIAQQRRAVEAARVEVERKRSHWLDARQHAQALDKVVERYRRDEAHAAGRREQADTDERAQQIRAPRTPESEQ